jgi:predicted transcriptional regulator
MYFQESASSLSKYAYILLTNEKWWKRRVAQSRAGKEIQAFVRKNAVGPIKTELLLFYVNNPVREVCGTGKFVERVVGEIENLWKNHSEETVFESNDEYLAFMQGRTKATFIRFRNLKELNPPIPLKRVLQIIGVSRLPRTGKYLSEEAVRNLSEATPIAEL